MSRCTGHCCRRFNLPVTLDEIQRRRNAEVCPPGEKHIEDGDKLAEMLIPLESTEINHWFTCRHFDPQSGDCTNYENRPRLCREFPYGRDCEYDGCTMDVSGIVQLRIEVKDAV